MSCGGGGGSGSLPAAVATSSQAAEDGGRPTRWCSWGAALPWQAGRGAETRQTPLDPSPWVWEDKMEMRGLCTGSLGEDGGKEAVGGGEAQALPPLLHRGLASTPSASRP